MATGSLSARRQGVLVDWHDARGFGFISPADGGRRVFAHVSAFPSGRRPVAGLEVTYTEVVDERGRPSATGVTYVRARRAGRARAGGVRRASAVAVPFVVLVGVLVALDRLPVGVLAAYCLASLVAVAAYGLDKSAATRRSERVPESALHVVALAGGWPGALVAQQVLRHKTIKQPFRSIFWGTVAANCVALAWLALGMPTSP